MAARADDRLLAPSTAQHKKDRKDKFRLASSSSSSDNTEEGLQRSMRKNGRFVNPWPTWKFPTIGGLLKWMLFTKDHSRVPSKQVHAHYI